jgi:hypothetical protein
MAGSTKLGRMIDVDSSAARAGTPKPINIAIIATERTFAMIALIIVC